jgi:uncharacterized protein (DUF697 family)
MEQKGTEVDDVTVAEPAEVSEEIIDVDKVIRNHVLGAMGIGLIPIPLVDIVALTGVQLNLLRRLAKAYNIPFSKDIGKHAIGTLVGSTLPIAFSGPLASLIKTIPIIGMTTGVLVMPAISGASTYALAKVFIQHFESGGTFLNFDPEQVKEYYAEMLKEGKKVAANTDKTVDVS